MIRNIAGIDIGFGDTKVFTLDKCIKFPTCLAIDYDGGVDLGEFGTATKNFLYNGKKYIVGEDALWHDPISTTKDIRFLINYAPVILAYAKTLVYFETVFIGLPVGYFTEHSKEFRSKITSFNINTKPMSFNVGIIPQGLGIICDYAYNLNGTAKNYVNNVIAIDIGYNTVDIVVMLKGKAIPQLSFMLENKGICVIANKLAKKLGVIYKTQVSEHKAKEFLKTKIFKMYQTNDDISQMIFELISDYSKNLLDDIMTNNTELLKDIDVILLSGGGASLIKDNIPIEHSDKITFARLGDAEFSNAVGFYKYGVRNADKYKS